MKSCIGFVGILAVGNCDRSSTSRRSRHKIFHQPSSLSHPEKHRTKGNINFNSNRYYLPAIHAIRGGASATQLNLSASATMASLLAGSVGGAIGVGISYPFDTLSTKAQVSTGNDEKHLNFVSNMKYIWKNQGIFGFFEGVLVTVRNICCNLSSNKLCVVSTPTHILELHVPLQMIGQAIIKAIQFAVNEMTFVYLENHSSIQSNIIKMAIAGTLAGLLSSFVVSPVELVKIRMQAQSKPGKIKKDDDVRDSAVSFNNEFDCARWMIRNEGLRALFCHGLGITIIREIPSFALYFVAYGLLARSNLADVLGGHAAPLIFGAIAGWAMWIPTYPIDIVKTIVQVQTTEKGTRKELLSSWQVSKKLYHAGGLKSFFDGLEPKLARAAVKHAVTFWVYELLMKLLRP